METPYNVLKQNLKQKLHTLLLLDLNPLENKFMSINDAIDILLKIENKKLSNESEKGLGKSKTSQRKQKIFTKKTKIIGCARLGSNKPLILYDTAEKLKGQDFGKPPFCLIVPGKMHFMEEEALIRFKRF